MAFFNGEKMMRLFRCKICNHKMPFATRRCDCCDTIKEPHKTFGFVFSGSLIAASGTLFAIANSVQ